MTAIDTDVRDSPVSDEAPNKLASDPSPRRRSGRSKSGAPWLLVAVGTVLAMAFAFPAAYLVWRNYTEQADPFELLFSDRTLAPLWRTIELAVLVSATATIMGSGLAWVTTRTDVPGRRFWQVVLPLPLVIPTFIGAAAFLRTVNPGGLAGDFVARFGIDETIRLQGLFGAWLVLSMFTYPYVYLPVSARLRQLPGSLEESARVLGDSAFVAFRRVVLPQISSAIGAGALLVFLYTISDFGAVQLMRFDTLTRAIFTNKLNFGVALALAQLLLVLAAVVVLAERWFSSRTHGFDRTRQSQVVIYRLGRHRWPVFGLVALAVVASVGAPMVALVDWAVSGLSRVADGGRLTIDAAGVATATWHTFFVSSLAAIAAVAAVLPVALLVGRFKAKGAGVAHALVISSFAVPGLLIALALQFWTFRSGPGLWFKDTTALLVFAYVVRFGALAMGVTLVAIRSVPAQLHDAAATLGAAATRRFRTIDVPIMTPALLAGAGLVLLSTMKELPISFLISPIGFSTLATEMFKSFEDAFVAEAGIMAVVLVSLSSVLSWFLVLRRADHL